MGANYMKLKLNLIIVPKNVLTTENRINWGQPETLQSEQTGLKGKNCSIVHGSGSQALSEYSNLPILLSFEANTICPFVKGRY